MITYSKFRPSGFDTAGLNLPERQEWLVAPCGRNRDSSVLDESNFEACLTGLGQEGEDVEVHRFGHWACGWFEIILVRPGSAAEVDALDTESALADYPVLDDSDYSERLEVAAGKSWAEFGQRGRFEYYRKHASDFSFRCFSDMLGCLRGKFFAGDTMSFAEGT